MIQSADEQYLEMKIKEIVGKEIIINPLVNEGLIVEYNYKNNGPGFDRLLISKLGNKRIQIKFRQVDGKTPYSKQTHFSNTRRHSKKHVGKSDSTGMITYSKNEFDYVLVILCHLKDGVRTNYVNWSFSLVPSEELVDVNNNSFLLPNIPSDKLYKYKCDDIYILTEKLKNI
jgi:hypothetical protein